MASSSSAASVSSSSSKSRRKSKDKGSTSKSASSSKKLTKDAKQDDTPSQKQLQRKSQRSSKSQSQTHPSSPKILTDSKTQSSSVTIDLLLRVANYTFLHPWVAWMVPLSFRAQAMPYSHSAMRYSIIWAAFLTLLWVLKTVDARIAYGPPRAVNIAPLKGKNKRKKKKVGKGRKLKGEVDDDDDADGEMVDGEDEELMVVTGGGSGLGKALAGMYGMRRVGVASLDVKGNKEDEEKGVRWFPCDVGIKEQVEHAKVKIEDELGTPTILVNNAGLMLGKSILDLSPDEIERSIRVNFLAHYHTVKAFLPGMLTKGRGTIVTVSSVLANYGAANLSDYTACKAALHTFHASLAAELARSNHPSASKIKTILVAPGQMATPMFARVQTPSTFLSPIASPLDVAKEIARVIDAGDGGFVAEPAHARFAWWWYVLTPGLRTLVRQYSGIDEAIR